MKPTKRENDAEDAFEIAQSAGSNPDTSLQCPSCGRYPLRQKAEAVTISYSGNVQVPRLTGVISYCLHCPWSETKQH